MLTCRVCGESKEESQFNKRSNGQYRKECRTCKNKYAMERYFKVSTNKHRAKPSDPSRKVCVHCGKEKELDQFTLKHREDPRYKLKDYYFCACKECEHEYMRTSKKNSYSGSKECTREHNLRKYGITTALYEEMLTKQNGVCYICHGQTNGRGRFAVDHCHKTGKLRKLLCSTCNTALGLVRDDVSILQNMISYLKEFSYGSDV